jgi:photosystem II stability/assembly factor-like uncharacterized protein
MYRLIGVILALAALVGSGCGALSPTATAPTATATHSPATPLPPTPTAAPPTATATRPPATPTVRPADVKPTPPPLVNPDGPKASDTLVAKVVSVPGADVGITAAAFLDDTHGWIGLGKVIMATTDGGQKWEEEGQLSSKVNALDFTSENRGWAATETGLYTTGDGGRVWATMGTVKQEPMNAVDFVDEQYGWVATDNNEFRRTTDGGVTWTVAASPCPANVGLGAFSFNDPENGWMLCGGVPGAGQQRKQLFTTADGGQHWNLVAGESPQPSPSTVPDSLPTAGYVSDLYFLNSKLGWMTTSRGGLYRSADGGLTWKRVAVGAEGEEFLRFPRFVTAEQGYVVSTQGQPALLGTQDGGATWTQLYPGLWPISAFDLVNGQIGFGAGTVQDPGAVLETTNRGRSWEQVASLKGEEILGFSFVNPQRGWAIAERYDGGAIISSLYRTSDGGGSWERVSETSDLKELYRYVSFVDESTGYIGSGWGHLSVTHNGGETWEVIDGNDSKLSDLVFVSPDIGWKIDDFNLFATEDGGITWTAIPLGYRALQFDLHPEGFAWVVAGDCASGACTPLLLFTTDGGQTWTRYDLGDVQPATIDFGDSIDLWLSGDRGSLYSSFNGGETWTQLR